MDLLATNATLTTRISSQLTVVRAKWPHANQDFDPRFHMPD
jgi:hypothetical protein